jgi:4-amino-4-deoxy-L-arabinose transferase-like glycosyltransferase
VTDATTPRLWLAAVLLTALTCLWQLSALPVSRSQEVRVAETAREMLANGDYLLPRLNGELRLQKPPLAYWLTAASYRALGRVDEFAARLPAALTAALVMLGVFAWTARAHGPDAALGTLAVLGASVVTLRFFHSAETDPLLLLWVCLGSLGAWGVVGGERPARASRLLLWASITGGTLAKGLPPALLPLLTGVAWCVAQRRYQRIVSLLWPPGVLLLLVGGGAWYAYVWLRAPDAFASLLGREIGDTYLRGDHAGPPWYYLPRVFLYFAPWSVLLPLLWTYRRGTGRPALDFVLAWLATTFVVLSLNVNKQIQYALLLAPPLAILLGVRLAAGLPRAHLWRRAAQGFGTLLVVACAWLAVRLGSGWLAAVPLVATALIGTALRSRARAGTVLLAVAMIAAFRLGEAYGLRRHHDTASQQRAVGLAARGLAPLATMDLDEPVLAFYAHAVPLRLDPTALAARVGQAGTVYLIAPGEQVERLDLPGNLVAEPLLTQPRISLWRVHEP